MSDERNIPDDLWRQAFNEADETPPPRVWDAIERQLDESEGPKVLPLWGIGPALSRPMAWGVGLAAAVALLLVGVWILRTNPGEQPTLAQTQSASQPGRSQNQKPEAELPQPAPAGIASEGIASAAQPTASAARPRSDIQPSAGRRPLQPQPETAIATAERPANATDDEPSAQAAGRTAARRMASAASASAASAPGATLPADPSSAVALTRSPADARLSQFAVSSYAGEKQPLLAYEPLQSRNLRLREPRPIQRIVWFRPAEADRLEPQELTGKRNDREVWASVSMMPGSFNPSVSVQMPTVASISSMNTGNTSSSNVSSRASFSVAYQAGAGVQLTERWSIESGVGYLSGRSTVESPGQAATYGMQAAVAGGAEASNLYADLLRNQSGKAMTATNSVYGLATDYIANNSRFNNLNSYDGRTARSVTNDYQYVQVPVQVGYQLLPRKRLSLAVLGGLMTNIFVRNTVDKELVINPQDGIYRPVSWAASMGARFRYRPSHRWSASLAGVYQPSLGLGTQTDSPVQSRPTSTGMTFGIDYHF